jgi:hypothetical protein
MLHTTRFDALMENCFFYISRMYEFLHRLGRKQTTDLLSRSRLCPKSGHRRNAIAAALRPIFRTTALTQSAHDAARC